jgi:hypothetical protein
MAYEALRAFWCSYGQLMMCYDTSSETKHVRYDTMVQIFQVLDTWLGEVLVVDTNTTCMYLIRPHT